MKSLSKEKKKEEKGKDEKGKCVCERERGKVKSIKPVFIVQVLYLRLLSLSSVVAVMANDKVQPHLNINLRHS